LKTILLELILPAILTNEILLDGTKEMRSQKDLAKLLDIPIVAEKLLLSMLAYSIILFLLIVIIWVIVVKKL